MPEKIRYYPEREEFVRLSVDSNLIPVYREIVADLETPVSVYAKVSGGGCSCLLESVEGSAKLSRYSFIACDPFLTLRAYGERLVIEKKGQTVTEQKNLFTALREMLKSYRVAALPGLPRFFGGAVGYIGYDAVRLFEGSQGKAGDDLEVPDSYLVFPESVIVFDHYTSRLKIIVNGRIEGNPGASYSKAVKNIEQLVETIRSSNSNILHITRGKKPATVTGPLKSNISRQAFLGKVKEIKQYIGNGHIQQAVLSQRFESALNTGPFQVYRALRTINPSPYMYYLDFGGVTVAGASPEMLVRVEDGIVETRPIAGTRPRGKNPEADRKLEEELINDPKERSEHMMLVDLGRDDLGRVSESGSVEVPVFMSCERYSHVMHMVSEVRGKLAAGRDALDAFLACFPAGTVSGSPRDKAMEIIDELEPTRRGPYAGAVGYFSFSGNMDTCITIRTIVFAKGKAYAQAGAGVVAGSRPDREYEETVNKAKVLMEAIRSAEEGF